MMDIDESLWKLTYKDLHAYYHEVNPDNYIYGS